MDTTTRIRLNLVGLEASLARNPRTTPGVDTSEGSIVVGEKKAVEDLVPHDSFVIFPDSPVGEDIHFVWTVRPSCLATKSPTCREGEMESGNETGVGWSD